MQRKCKNAGGQCGQTRRSVMGISICVCPKKDGNPHFYVDYHWLNAVTARDSYPILRMDDYNDLLGEAQMFSTLGANLRYWQIEMEDKDIDKTAFVTHHELLKYS